MVISRKHIQFILVIVLLILLPACYSYENSQPTQVKDEEPYQSIVEVENQNQITFVFTRPVQSPVGQWYYKVYFEAFNRLGYDFKMESAPPERANTYTSDGLYDGQASRMSNYDQTHKNHVRIDEPLIYVHFSVFSIEEHTGLDTWQDLLNSDLTIAYRMGVAKVENKLVHSNTQNRLIKTYGSKSAIDHLVDGTADVYVDVESYVYSYLKSQDFSDQNYEYFIRNLGTIEVDTGHGFLNDKHADLAPLLSDVLKDMKSENLFKAYFDDLELQPSDIYIHTEVK